MRRLLPGLVFFAITFAVAAVGALFTPGPWYEALAKPAWTPPGWVFAPVWTALYATIAVAGWVIWSARARIDLALILWGIQLALNGIWSWLFFGLENPAFAAVDIVLLLLAIVATIRAFAPISRRAAALLLPYALWVGFASALNIAIWRLNA